MLRQSNRKVKVTCNLLGYFYNLACNEDVGIVFHTPRACSHLALNGYWDLRKRACFREPDLPIPKFNNFFVTNISDKEAIFGGEKLLKKCLCDVVALKYIKYIVVVVGCTAGVIGDDVLAIAKEVEEEGCKPIIVAPGAGFMSGGYIENNAALFNLLLDRFTKPKKIKGEKTATFIGEIRGSGNELNIIEIKRLLNYFNFKKVIMPPSATKMEDFACIADTEVFIPVALNMADFKRAQKFSNELAKKYNAKSFVNNYPIGIENTVKWLKDLGDLLGEEKRAKAAIKEEERKVAELFVKADLLKGKSYAMIVNTPKRYFNVINHIKILEKAGMILKRIILHNDLSSEEKIEQREAIENILNIEIIEYDSYDENKLKKYVKDADVILTTTGIIGLPHQLCMAYQMVGTWGVENLLKKVSKTVNRRGRRIIYEY